MPETKNKSFDEIAKILSGDVQSSTNNANSNTNIVSVGAHKGIESIAM